MAYGTCENCVKKQELAWHDARRLLLCEPCTLVPTAPVAPPLPPPGTAGTCTGCGRSKPLSRSKRTGTALCSTCKRKSRAGAKPEHCSGCGNLRRACVRIDGMAVCHVCRQNDASTHEQCAECKTRARVASRSDKGPLCGTCHRRLHREKCCRCHHEKPVACRLKEGPICPNCWQKDPSTFERCDGCARRRHINRRIDDKSYCVICARRLRKKARANSAAL
jgi:hypothetical protein